jgi:hypothetical protein
LHGDRCRSATSRSRVRERGTGRRRRCGGGCSRGRLAGPGAPTTPCAGRRGADSWRRPRRRSRRGGTCRARGSAAARAPGRGSTPSPAVVVLILRWRRPTTATGMGVREMVRCGLRRTGERRCSLRRLVLCTEGPRQSGVFGLFKFEEVAQCQLSTCEVASGVSQPL